VTVLAANTSAFDQPGTLGFLVVFGMAVILYFVFRSMAKHLRRVNTAAKAEAMAASSSSDTPPGSASAAEATAPKDTSGPSSR
jgi:hypothetical protein